MIKRFNYQVILGFKKIWVNSQQIKMSYKGNKVLQDLVRTLKLRKHPVTDWQNTNLRSHPETSYSTDLDPFRITVYHINRANYTLRVEENGQWVETFTGELVRELYEWVDKGQNPPREKADRKRSLCKLRKLLKD